MNGIQPPHLIPQGGNYAFYDSNKRLWLVLFCQLCICIFTGIFLSFCLFKELYVKEKRSWKSAVDAIKPLEKRLMNLEKERIVWASYVEWIEDYCSVYYDLVHYLNSATSDLGKMFRDRCKSLKNFPSISDKPVQSVSQVISEHPSENEQIVTEEKELQKNDEVKFPKMKSRKKSSLNGRKIVGVKK